MSPAPAPMIMGLLRPQAFPHPAPQTRLIETHISWVILAGEHAYKIKKPVRLGFLDFSHLEARHFYCLEELRLNRRLAADIYLDVVPITGSPDTPRFGGAGEVLDWAVHMRAFDPQSGLDHAPPLTNRQAEAIALQVAEFHSALAPVEGDAGGEVQTLNSALDNFSQLRDCLPPDSRLGEQLDRLEAWTRRQGIELQAFFATRKAQGHVRECHGDLHLGNIAWWQDRPLIFDALEFNPELRCIDTLSECAFLMMDLIHHGQSRQAWRFLNTYLERCGDYTALPGLPFYLAYRALVRAKVAAIRDTQDGGDLAEVRSHVELAEHCRHPRGPGLILMHGLSGSGKSLLSAELMESLGAIRLRSDVERKRLYGLNAEQSSQAINGGIYTREAGERTRQRLLELCQALLTAGCLVIVDATFISRSWREPFAALADALGIKWCIVSLEVAEAQLRQRLRQRSQQGGDASEADEKVLDAQLAHHEPLNAQEEAHKIRVTAVDEAGTLGPTICESLALIS